MAFNLIDNLFSWLSSAIAYVAAAFFFSNKTETMVAFGSALIVIIVVLFLVRLLFFKGTHRMQYAMRSMQPRGFMLRRMARTYKHTKERKVISGGVARILAFGVIFYLTNNILMYAYMVLAFALIVGITSIIAFRHKFIDLISGTILGLVAGYFAFQFAPLIVKMLGF
ncbi:MAG: hypothetical protein WC758_05250 [Candidatus Woesearchaeota archaeon]